MPGVTTRNVSLKRLSWGLASLLSACQAMSMAMTTVLPDPVAILNAMRYRPGFLPSFSSRRRASIQGWLMAGDLGDVDGRLERLDLAEEERRGALGVLPVAQQLAGDRGDARVVGLAPGGRRSGGRR